MHWLVVSSVLCASSVPLTFSAAAGEEQEQGRGSSSGAPSAGAAEQVPSQAEGSRGAAAEPRGPSAQAPDEKKKLEEEIAKELGAQPGQGSAPAPSPGAPPPGPPPPAQGQPGGVVPPQGQVGGNPFARLLLLPDISAIGRGALAWNHLDVGTLSPRGDPFAPAHTVQAIFEELELGVQAVVDPYARADVFLSFTSDGAEIEEAYLTTLGLPAGLQVRAGKLFAPFGRQNQQHAHVWDFVDRPLALARLLGSDALKGPGLEVAWLAPTPWFAELHIAYQALTPAFEVHSRNAGVARLAQFFDVGEASTLGLGVSGALLQEQQSGASREIYGADVYLKIRPLSARSYAALQGEVVARRLTGAVGAADEPPEESGTLWGGYVQAIWRDGPYLAYGARYERAPAVQGGPEHRVSAIAGWLPSEFQRIRLQISYDRLPGGQDGLEALLHFEFSIGAHGAHPF